MRTWTITLSYVTALFPFVHTSTLFDNYLSLVRQGNEFKLNSQSLSHIIIFYRFIRLQIE